MAFRGRGRGRGGFGGGGGGFGYARQEPFVEFPEIDLPERKSVKEERALVVLNLKLLNHWKSSAYYLEDSSLAKKSQSMDIERFSDWGKPKTTAKRDALSNFLLLEPTNFPKELVTGAKREQPNPKKVRWNPSSDLQKLDLFEKLEEKFQKGDKEKKEGEDEEEDEDGDEESQEAEEESDDDYLKNVDFDDDEDDYNDIDDGNNGEDEY